jgi:2-(1,2-epoxy-1,2-dihydrophenyl)acetyl-CoA isomerase
MVVRRKVQVNRDAGLAELVLCAPEQSNAIDLDTAEQLRDATADIAAADGLRAILVRAEGKNFCVGGDLHSFAAHGDELKTYVMAVANAAHDALENLARVRVPVVSAVQGAVAGAGVGIAFSADIVLIARSSKIRLAYTAVGLSPDNASSWLLPRLVGPRRALDLALTNRTVIAADAVAWGLASEVVDDANLLKEARETATRLAEGPSEALVATKRLFRESAVAGNLHEQLAREADTVSSLAATPYAREAIRRFVER